MPRIAEHKVFRPDRIAIPGRCLPRYPGTRGCNAWKLLRLQQSCSRFQSKRSRDNSDNSGVGIPTTAALGVSSHENCHRVCTSHKSKKMAGKIN
eukprot:2523143-Rhodomonas_salina.1